MLDFSTISNTSGSFPNVEAVNASGPTLKDGTPYNAAVLNDIWGAFQAILDYADVTPSGSAESSSASDLLSSIRKVAGAPGEIVMYATPSDVIAANILPLKGQVISVASYPDLVAATYIGDGNNGDSHFPYFYRATNALGTTRDPGGAYFKVPDCRGCFLRALSGAYVGVDPARDSDTTEHGVDFRNMSGKRYGDSPGWHKHKVVDLATGYPMQKQSYYVFPSDPGNVVGSIATVRPIGINMHRVQGAADDGLATEIAMDAALANSYATSYYDEVRPKNVAFQLGIRY